MTESSGRGPGVHFPPPLIFASAFLVGWLLDRYVLHLWPTTAPSVARTVMALGWVMVVAGVILAASGMVTFRRRRTSIVPNRDASTLVTDGPYRFTRNPMYTGLTILYCGVAILVGSVWPILLLPFALMVLTRAVILREERYLTEAFGDQYREYRSRVGRWF